MKVFRPLVLADDSRKEARSLFFEAIKKFKSVNLFDISNRCICRFTEVVDNCLNSVGLPFPPLTYDL